MAVQEPHSSFYFVSISHPEHTTTSFRILKDEEEKMKGKMKNIRKRMTRRKIGGRRCSNCGKAVCFHIIPPCLIKICHSTEMIYFHDLGLKVLYSKRSC
jgi:hypothetical protein